MIKELNLAYRVKRKLRSLYSNLVSHKLETLLYNPGNAYKLSHVALFANRGHNAGDILLPIVLKDLFISQLGGIKWKNFHVHRKVTSKSIDAINSTQGLVIGGGGLFLRDTNPNEKSGWQWACSVDQIRSIKVPFCLFAVGYNRFRGQEDFSPVFTRNLEVLATNSVYLGLRNTGSINAVRSCLPSSLHSKVIYQPCMTTLLSFIYPELFSNKKIQESSPFIALNCAFDRSALRFGSRKANILNEIALGVQELSKAARLGVKYYAHTETDLEMVDYLKAKSIEFEICMINELSPAEIIRAYQTPELVLGMRGHAQMIPFGCHTPILSLAAHDKLAWFIEDLNEPDWLINLNENNNSISENIVQKGKYILESRSKIKAGIKEHQVRLWNVTQKNINLFLNTLAP